MKKILLFCVCSALTAFSAHAEWEIGAHGCGLLGGGIKGRDIPGFGAHLVYVFTYIYSLEVAVSRYKAYEKIGGSRENLSITAAAATMRVHASPVTDRLGIYGGAGAGIYMRDFFGERDGERDNKIRPLAAMGARFHVSDRVSIFAEYRYILRDIRFQDSFDHGLVRIGASYYF